MKKLYIIIALVALMPVFSQAQSDADALRYSMLDFGGTARSLGSANAYGAVGGDFSSTSINPAGLGIYRSSEFVFSPGLASFNSESNFLNETNDANKYDFYLGNISYVMSGIKEKNQGRTDGWVGANFGIGYNKLANYNNEVFYSGFNESSSLLDVYAAHLDGVNPSDAFQADPFGAGLAWETYLLNPNPDDSSTYYGVVNGGNVRQSKSIVTKGGNDEMTLSLAGNYANRLYIGGTVGIPFIRYDNTTNYTEEDQNEVHPDFINFTETDMLRTTGTGINVKAGIIYKVSDYVRLGAAFHSPTLYQMHDVYSSSISSSLDMSGDFSFDSPIGEYDYELVTPWRFTGSAALTFQKYGFLSADYEFVDYSASNFNFNNNSISENTAESNVNNAITTKYGGASNIRIGGEFVYDIFRFRAGYAILGSPFNEGIATGDADYSKNTYTAGIGIKEESFFIDLGYGHSISHAYDIQYILPDAPEAGNGATIDNIENNFQLSLGFRF